MNSDTVGALVFVAAVVALYLLIRRLRRTKRIFIPDFQRGVRFVNGVFRGVLGPGSYRSYPGRDQINLVDMRPNPFLEERLQFEDALQSPSIMSIGAELTVSDPHLAYTKLQDPVDDSIPMAREVIESFAAKNIADTSAAARVKTAEEITEAVNSELSQFGVRISNLEITELWSRPLQQGARGAN
jgi:hypothetical protein